MTTRHARTHDAIIIGAGPAGASLAALLARDGLRILLVDRASFPRHKVCGCCLAGRGVRALDRMGLAGAFAGATTADRAGLMFGRSRSSVRLPQYTLIGRNVLDSALIDLATQAGAELRTSTAARVAGIGADHASVRLAPKGGETELVRAAAVIACDGLTGGSLRDLSSMRWRVARHARIGMGFVIPIDDLSAPPLMDEIVMSAGPAGYAGLAPLTGGVVSVAAALTPGRLPLGGPRAEIARLLSPVGVTEDALVGRTTHGAPGLKRSRAAVELGGRVFAAGDAASYVEPFTGEGMSWAIEDAEAIAPVIRDVARGALAPGRWTGVRAAMVRRRTAGCRAVASVLRNGVTRRIASAAVRTSPALAGAVARRVLGSGPAAESGAGVTA